MRKTAKCILCLFLASVPALAGAQSDSAYIKPAPVQRHELMAVVDSDAIPVPQLIPTLFQEEETDAASKPKKQRMTMREKDSIIMAQVRLESVEFTPDPKKATIFSMVIPGGGQIYNRKYWKLPVVYGGYVGCIYALTWNNQMYKDYMQAYIDIMDDDPNTKSYEDFLPPRYDVESNKSWLQGVLKNRKDSYRRYRDMSIFAFAGVYLISIIDAYVDAELSHFDVSRDLSLRIRPEVAGRSSASLGLNFSINF